MPPAPILNIKSIAYFEFSSDFSVPKYFSSAVPFTKFKLELETLNTVITDGSLFKFRTEDAFDKLTFSSNKTPLFRVILERLARAEFKISFCSFPLLFPRVTIASFTAIFAFLTVSRKYTLLPT